MNWWIDDDDDYMLAWHRTLGPGCCIAMGSRQHCCLWRRSGPGISHHCLMYYSSSFTVFLIIICFISHNCLRYFSSLFVVFLIIVCCISLLNTNRSRSPLLENLPAAFQAFITSPLRPGLKIKLTCWFCHRHTDKHTITYYNWFCSQNKQYDITFDFAVEGFTRGW